MAAVYLLFFAALLLEAGVCTASSREQPPRYRTVEANATLLRLLLDPNRNETVRSEIYDMLHSRDMTRAAPAAPAFPPAPPQPYLAPDMQTEQLQGPDVIVKKDSSSSTWRSGLGRTRPTFQGAVTGIMLGLTCIIVLVAYVSLVAYRRYIMIKTGNKHELLRNEDSGAETRIDL